MKNRIILLSILICFGCFCFGFTGCSKKNVAQIVEYPKRIVALSPAAAEILFAVGAGGQIAAVSQFTDFPAEAFSLPQVGGFDGKTLSLETIISFKPDLVYMTNGMHNFMIEQLESYGIKYYLSKAESVQGVMAEIKEIGELTGHKEQAQVVVEQMCQKIGAAGGIETDANETTSVKSAGGKKSTQVYWEVWNAPYMSAGNSSFINDVISSAGGKNIFDDLAEAYPVVSEEAIIKREPEVILIPASSGISAANVCARSGWENVPAVKNGRIFIVDDNVYTRPGPRIADVILELSGKLGE